ncbi:hypothetical protein [Streptomyces celluloflavus]|uniref:hypothetical protein n=1 Tax=Streptomyces celluloflavus TaxID=58344 RepID=UPI00364EDC30
MTSLFDRLEKEEAIVREELDALREKISVVEERLIRLTITRDTLRSLSTDGAPNVDTDPADDSSPLDLDGDENQSAEAAGSGEATEPSASEPLGLKEARERMLELLTRSRRAMKASEITTLIGDLASRSETTRSRLKKLVVEGRVVEEPTGWFAIAPGVAAAESGSEG